MKSSFLMLSMSLMGILSVAAQADSCQTLAPFKAALLGAYTNNQYSIQVNSSVDALLKGKDLSQANATELGYAITANILEVAADFANMTPAERAKLGATQSADFSAMVNDGCLGSMFSNGASSEMIIESNPNRTVTKVLGTNKMPSSIGIYEKISDQKIQVSFYPINGGTIDPCAGRIPNLSYQMTLSWGQPGLTDSAQAKDLLQMQADGKKAGDELAQLMQTSFSNSACVAASVNGK
jgi:hypothetical protein